MYINDDEIDNCLNSVDNLLKSGGKVYIKEPIGVSERLTLTDFFSEELNSNYNAIYRGLNEYEQLFTEHYYKKEYGILSSGSTWSEQLENRKETMNYYWILKNNRR